MSYTIDRVLEGVARGLDHDGHLLVERDDGSIETVRVGDVTVVREVPKERGECGAPGH